MSYVREKGHRDVQTLTTKSRFLQPNDVMDLVALESPWRRRRGTLVHRG